MRALLLTILLSFIIKSVPLFSQNSNQHPIDKWLNDCITQNQSTTEMLECAKEAYTKWDKELNNVYKELMKLLDSNSQKKLKESQKQWLKYRDEEFSFIGQLYSTKEGTMYLPMRYFDMIEIIKNRVLILKNYIQVLKDM